MINSEKHVSDQEEDDSNFLGKNIKPSVLLDPNSIRVETDDVKVALRKQIKEQALDIHAFKEETQRLQVINAKLEEKIKYYDRGRLEFANAGPLKSDLNIK